MNQSNTLKRVITQSHELKRIDSFQLGSLVKIEVEKNRIWVDYANNPTAKPLLAKLGTPWIGSEELQEFLGQVDSVKLEFLDGDPTRPIIRDLFFSVNGMNRSKSQSTDNKVIEIDADEIILKGKRRITIQCGAAKTVYKAEGSRIIQEAESIESSAESSNRVKGGSVLLN